MFVSNSESAPAVYPQLDQFEVANGRHLVLIEYDSFLFVKSPTLKKVYKVVTLTLLESITDQLPSLEYLLAKKNVGICIVSTKHLQALYVHATILQKFKENGVEGFLIQYDAKVIGFIPQQFEPDPLQGEDYENLVEEGFDALKAPQLRDSFCSLFYKEGLLVEGSFPFCMAKHRAVSTGKLSELNRALHFEFLGNDPLEEIKACAADGKLAFLHFEEGKCVQIQTHARESRYVKCYELLSIQMDTQLGLLPEQPAIVGIADAEYKKQVGLLCHGDVQKSRCLVS